MHTKTRITVGICHAINAINAFFRSRLKDKLHANQLAPLATERNIACCIQPATTVSGNLK